MKTFLLRTFLLIAIFASFTAFGQTETEEVPASLDAQYNQMIEGSETFQQYKVIPITKMNAFKEVMKDSIDRYISTIDNLKQEKSGVEAQNDSLQQALGQTKVQLAETEKQVDSIDLFGLLLSKSVYNLILWGVIIGLIAGLVFLYLAFLNANRVSKNAKQEKLRVDDELEELRKSAHEKQVKIKRELQTALNKLEEMNK